MIDEVDKRRYESTKINHKQRNVEFLSSLVILVCDYLLKDRALVNAIEMFFYESQDAISYQIFITSQLFD